MTSENRFERIYIRYKNHIKAISYIFKIIGIASVSLILLEMLSYMVISIVSLFQFNNSSRKSEVYQDKIWAEKYWEEFDQSFDAIYSPYSGYRRKPNYQGHHINLDQHSIRKTINPCADADPKVKNITIFMFGGSTTWGTGARDQGTIPSFLSQDLCNSDLQVEITNFAESGYNSTQGMIRLFMELRKNHIPDIVIFYDGINDMHASIRNKKAGLPQNLQNRHREFNSLKKRNIRDFFPYFLKIVKKITSFFSSNKSQGVRRSNPLLEEETVNIYFGNIKLIQYWETHLSFKSFFFWNPSVHSKQFLSEYEEKNIGQIKNKYRKNFYLSVTELINKKSDVKSLSDIFNSNKETIFIDGAHISEEGNAIIAQAMAENVINYIKQKNNNGTE